MFGTPLQVAAYNGHLGVAQLLLLIIVKALFELA